MNSINRQTRTENSSIKCEKQSSHYSADTKNNVFYTPKVDFNTRTNFDANF